MSDILLVEGDNELNVELIPISPPVANLYGVVTDANTGEPIENVPVYVTPNGHPDYHGRTDINGYYEITNIIPGDYKIIVSAVGYQRKDISQTLVVGDNELNIELIPKVEAVPWGTADYRSAKDKEIAENVLNQRLLFTEEEVQNALLALNFREIKFYHHEQPLYMGEIPSPLGSGERLLTYNGIEVTVPIGSMIAIPRDLVIRWPNAPRGVYGKTIIDCFIYDGYAEDFLRNYKNVTGGYEPWCGQWVDAFMAFCFFKYGLTAVGGYFSDALPAHVVSGIITEHEGAIEVCSIDFTHYTIIDASDGFPHYMPHRSPRDKVYIAWWGSEKPLEYAEMVFSQDIDGNGIIGKVG